MGTPLLAAVSLQVLLDGPDQVVGVVTQPDRARGRGKKVTPSPVKALALERGLQVMQPERIKGERGAAHRAELVGLKPDFLVVVAYGKILPVEVLQTPLVTCLNLHPSLLPRWRGAAPIQAAIAAGDATSGVCIMEMEEGLDTGPVYLRRELTLSAKETGGSLHDKLATVGGEALMATLDLFRDGTPEARPQDDDASTYAPMLKKEDGRLGFQRTAVELERRIRAYQPWPGAFTRLQGKGLKVIRAALVDGAGEPGTVLAVSADGIDVACGDGALRLLEVQPEGKRPMDVRSWLAGRDIAVGERLGE